jgi:aminodeoxyfutalosine deaminase
MIHPHISADWVYFQGQLHAKWSLSFSPTGLLTGIGPTDHFVSKDAFHFAGVVCPGFVNAHCHLELSHLQGRIARHTGMVPFLKAVSELRNTVEQADRLHAIRSQISELSESGTEVVIDICNSAESLPIKSESNVSMLNLFEIFGLNQESAESRIAQAQQWQQKWSMPSAIVPHAPYSLRPETMAEIAQIATSTNRLLSIHCLESQAEVDLFKGTGDFLSFFASIGVDYLPHHSHPLDLLFEHFSTDHQVLYVHLTAATPEDIQRIRFHTPTHGLVLCLRANEYIQNTAPDVHIFDWQHDTILVGTDSLASNDDLSIIEELKAIQQWNSALTIKELLQIAVDNPRKLLSYALKMTNFIIGTRPFVTGITDIDSHRLKLTPDTRAICLQS